jgi:DNA-binding MarR family transcriptional regulator
MRTNSPVPGSTTETIARISTRVGEAVGELRCIASERLVQQGISMSHLHVLSVLDRHGEMPMSRIAESLGVSDSNATGIVDRMEERGIVARCRVADDRRVVHVRLTDRGHAVLAEVGVLKDDLLQRVLGHLDAGQLTRLEAALDDVLHAVGAVVGETPDAFPGHAHLPADDRRPAAVPS